MTAEYPDVAERIDRFIHDAEHAEAGATFADSLGHTEQANKLRTKAFSLREQAEMWEKWAPAIQACIEWNQQQAPRTGRPHKFTPDAVAVILQAVRDGDSYEVACGMARVSYSTFREWDVAGEDDQWPYSEFSEALTQAESESLHEARRALGGHYEKDFRASLAVLERRDRANWGKQETHIMRDERQPAAQHVPVVNLLTPAGLNQLAQLLQQPQLPAPDVVEGQYRED